MTFESSSEAPPSEHTHRGVVIDKTVPTKIRKK